MAALEGFRDRVDAQISGNLDQLELLGTSGTVTTLASVYLGLEVYDRRKVDGARVPVAGLMDVARRLVGVGMNDRAELPCIGPERADLVVAGCAVLEAIARIWPAETLSIADRGIREGILRQLMRQDGVRI